MCLRGLNNFRNWSVVPNGRHSALSPFVFLSQPRTRPGSAAVAFSPPSPPEAVTGTATDDAAVAVAANDNAVGLGGVADQAPLATLPLPSDDDGDDDDGAAV